MRFHKTQHLGQVKEWAKARGWDHVDESTFSSIGFIIPGVVAGFLYPTPSSVAYGDNLIANPQVGPLQVYDGTKRIIAEAKDVARTLGFQHIVIVTDLSPSFFKRLGAVSPKPFYHILPVN